MKTVLLMLSFCLIGFAATYVSIPFARRFSKKYSILSIPRDADGRDKPTPLLGGAAIYLSFALVSIVFFLMLLKGKYIVTQTDRLQMLSLFLGATWIMVLGTLDDKFNLRWKSKLLGQIIGVVILALGGHTIGTATIPFFGPVNFGWWGVPIFGLAILTITNAINLIDGIDGLAGGICFFAALVIGILGISKGDIFSASIGFTFSGSLLAFLRFNFPPASIYMGDGGSLMLGFILGTLATSSVATAPGQRSGTMAVVLIPVLPFGIALVDVILSISRRWISGRKIFLPDMGHLHHRLMDKIGRPRTVVIILYIFSALLSAMTLTLVLGPKSRFFTIYVIVSVFVLLMLVAALLKLYMSENPLKIIENRFHFRFLNDFIAFMSKRIRRARNTDELFSLLEAGIRDLDFDTVEVVYKSRTIKKWVNMDKIHPNNPRRRNEKGFNGSGLTIRWAVPKHYSDAYQQYLFFVWNRFLEETNAKLLELQQQESPLPLSANRPE